jgi:4-amino-4-deoxy-L-arabinose transferase-like glycosyltransferase
MDDLGIKSKLSRKTITLHCILLFIFSMLLFLTFNYDIEIIKIDVRWALFVRYMFIDGINYFPTLFNHPYPDYPVIFTLLSYWIASFLHTINMFAITFPTSIMAAVTVVFTYLIGLFHSRKQALYAVLILLFSVKFFECARTPNPDFFVAAFTTIAFYFTYKSILNKSKTYLWIVPICFIIGFSFRGPIGLVIPAGVVCLTFLFSKRIKSFFVMGISAAVLLIIGVLGTYFMAYLQAGPEFAKVVTFSQSLGRFGDTDPIYYYFLASFGSYAISYPVAILTIIFLYKKFIGKYEINNEFHMLKYLFIWFIVIFIGLSIPGSKQDRYLLSSIPALALIASFFFNAKYITNRIHQLIVNFLNFLLFYMTIILFVALWIGYAVVSIAKIKIDYPILIPGVSLIVLSILAYTIVGVLKLRSNQLMKLLIGMLSFFILSVTFLQPLNLQHESSIKFVNAVQKIRTSNRPIVFFRLGPDGDDLKYLVNIKKMFVPICLNTPKNIAKYKKPYILIIKSSKFTQIPKDIRDRIKILIKGKLGHVDCVAAELD